jgi:hypothetical protein
MYAAAIETARVRLIARQQLLRKLAHVFLKPRRIDCDEFPELRLGKQWLGAPGPRHDSERRDD